MSSIVGAASNALSSHLVVASLEVASRWTEALQGNGDLTNAVSTVSSLTWADRCGLVRLNKRTGQSTAIAVFCKEKGKVYGGHWQSISHRILGTNLQSVANASVWLRSEIELNDAAADSIFDTARRWREIITIVIQNDIDHVDVLELQFQLLPSPAGYAVTKIMAGPLSNSWINRLPGTAERPKLRSIEISSENTLHPAQILTHNNPKGLSRAEFRICIMLRDGSNVSKMADTLGVGPNTIRKHLSTIFSKTGTNGQLELLHLLTLDKASEQISMSS